MMQNYLCLGLGIYLMCSIVDYANPLAGLTFAGHIINFLGIIALWPLVLLKNILMSIHMREVEEQIMEEMKKLMKDELISKEALDALRASGIDDNEKDRG